MTVRLLIVLGLIAMLTGIPGTSLPADANRFSEISKNIISDKETGLSWQKGDSYLEIKKGMNWYEAVEYVNKKNHEQFEGHNDWRLPTRNELKNIWDASRSIRSKDGELLGLPSMFAGGGAYYLWTSDERNLDHAWYFGMGQKEEYFNLKELGDLDQSVKLVRVDKNPGKTP